MPHYEIRLRGRVDPSWSTWLGDLALQPSDGGDTILSGTIADEAALHGVLARIRDMALELLSLRRLDG